MIIKPCPCARMKSQKRGMLDMKSYKEMTKEELAEEIAQLKKEYRKFQNMELHLDMSRGKPCQEQLDLSMHLMDVLDST